METVPAHQTQRPVRLGKLQWGVALAVLAFLGACLAQNLIPLILPPPDVNVTQTQYQAAYTRWRAAGVQEYEMVVDYQLFNGALRGLWHLKVQSEGRYDTVTDFSRLNSDESIYGFAGELQSLTVATMFDDIQGILNNPQDNSQFGGPRYYMVQFDQALGYPKHMEGHPRSEGVTDQDWSITVKSLTIVKK